MRLPFGYNALKVYRAKNADFVNPFTSFFATSPLVVDCEFFCCVELLECDFPLATHTQFGWTCDGLGWSNERNLQLYPLFLPTMPFANFAFFSPTEEVMWWLLSPRRRQYAGEFLRFNIWLHHVIVLSWVFRQLDQNHIWPLIVSIGQLSCDCQTFEIDVEFRLWN